MGQKNIPSVPQERELARAVGAELGAAVGARAPGLQFLHPLGGAVAKRGAVVAAAVKQTGIATSYAAAELRADADFMLSLVQLHPAGGSGRGLILEAAAEGIRAEVAARWTCRFSEINVTNI